MVLVECSLPLPCPTLGPHRTKMVEVLKDKFAEYGLTYSIGGQISFDVFPQVGATPPAAHSQQQRAAQHGLLTNDTGGCQAVSLLQLGPVSPLPLASQGSASPSCHGSSGSGCKRAFPRTVQQMRPGLPFSLLT